MPIRYALVEINPGSTRRIRRGKRRGGVITVKIDPKTKRALQAAAGGAQIPDYWVGVPWSKLPGLDRAMAAAARGNRKCHKLAKRCTWGGKRCRKTFGRRIELQRALEAASGGALETALENLDPGVPQLRELSEYAYGKTKGARRFKTWRQAVAWVAPRSRRWEDVDKMRLRALSDHMLEALEAGGGGMNTLTAADFNFGRLPLPAETERQLEKRRRAAECDEALELETAQLIDELARELEDVPF